eukprot:gene5702-6891_t
MPSHTTSSYRIVYCPTLVERTFTRNATIETIQAEVIVGLRGIEHVCSLELLTPQEPQRDPRTSRRILQTQTTRAEAGSVKCSDRAQHGSGGAWRDSRGKSCADYAALRYCTPAGGYGVGWKDILLPFQMFASSQEDARWACCSCGGGETAGGAPTTGETIVVEGSSVNISSVNRSAAGLELWAAVGNIAVNTVLLNVSVTLTEPLPLVTRALQVACVQQGLASCVIDADGRFGIFTVAGGSGDLLLRNLKLTNGAAAFGAAVSVDDGAYATLQ